MKQQLSLLLGAGAGLAAAMPAPEAWFIAGRNDHTSHHDSNHHGHTGKDATSSSVSSFPTTIVPSGSGYAPASSIAASFYVAVASGTVSAAPASSIAASSYVAVASGTVSAAPANSAASTSSGEVSQVSASADCTFTDVDSAVDGKADCTNIVLSGITVDAGVTLDMTDLTDGTTVTFEGTTSFGYEEWEGPLISFSGTDITIQGADGHEINMEGQLWWDGEGSNGGTTKPKGFYAHKLIDSTITGLNIKNTPVQCFSVNNAENLYIKDVTIDNSAGDGDDGGHNTDAFDVGSSTGVYISGATVYNQDDCLAINSGTDISFTGGYCSGGHGLSIGSVGGRDDNTVENVYIADTTVTASDNGVRIKTVYDATGTVKNVTYSGITLSDIAKYGVVIEQDYENGSPTGDPTDGVPISELTLEDITGSVTDDAAPYYILCASCSDWTVSSVDVTGGTAETDCEGEPDGVDLC